MSINAAGIKKNDSAGYTFVAVLIDSADNLSIKTNPTIAAGDFQISKDGVAFTNLGSLPTVTPAADDAVKFVLSQAEINADFFIVRAKDVAGAEWDNNYWSFTTQANSNADIKTETAVILADVTGIAGAAMRGTDSAATAAAQTTMQTDVSAILVDTTGLNGDVMRGTDSAATAAAQTTMQTDVTSILADTANIDSNVDQSLSITETNIRGADSDTLKSLSDQADLQATLAAQTTMQTDVLEALGLMQKNVFMDTPLFDGNNNLTSLKIDTYNSKANAQTHDGSTGIVARYTVTATYSGDNLATYLLVRDS